MCALFEKEGGPKFVFEVSFQKMLTVNLWVEVENAIFDTSGVRYGGCGHSLGI